MQQAKLPREFNVEAVKLVRVGGCGANLNNVVEIQGVMQEGKRNTFSMQDDLEAVSQWLAFAHDEGRPFAMLVIDPVTSYGSAHRGFGTGESRGSVKWNYSHKNYFAAGCPGRSPRLMP